MSNKKQAKKNPNASYMNQDILLTMGSKSPTYIPPKHRNTKSMLEPMGVHKSQIIPAYGLMPSEMRPNKFSSVNSSNMQQDPNLDDEVVVGLPNPIIDTSKHITSASSNSVKKKMNHRRRSSDKKLRKSIKKSPYVSKKFKNNVSEFIQEF